VAQAWYSSDVSVNIHSERFIWFFGALIVALAWLQPNCIFFVMIKPA